MIAALLVTLTGASAALAQNVDLPRPSISDRSLLGEAQKLRNRAAADETAWSLVESLTTEVGPRLAGSDGDKAAVRWAVEKLESLGFDRVYTEPVEVPHWDRGSLDVQILSPFPQKMVGAALGGSVGTPSGGISAEVVGVTDLEDLAELDPEQVAGKIVYIGSRMERYQSGAGYSPAVKKRSSGASEAAKLGAIGVIIRSVGTDDNRIAHTGAMRYAEDVKRIPAIAISNPDADLLERQLEREPVTVWFELTSRFLANEISANVIGEIEGETDEIVLLGAHLDSWDVGTGAHDDAAGVAIVTAAAHLIDALPGKPKRTLRVVLYANEEFGLSGARAYAAEHGAELDRHVVAMEADFGAGRVWQFGSRVDPEELGKVASILSVIAPLGIEWGNNETFGGADIGPLWRLGVPVLGPRQDATLYFDYHHTDNDTLDKIDPEHLRQNVAVYAVAAFIASNMEGNFGRLPVEE